MAIGRAGQAPPRRVREQARPGTSVVRADPRRHEGEVRCRHRAARAPDRRGDRVSRCRRPAHRHRDDVRGSDREGHRGRRARRDGRRGAFGPRRAHRGHRRRRRRPDGALPRRRVHRGERARAGPGQGHRRGDRVPGAVRQRDQAHRRRPPRLVRRARGAVADVRGCRCDRASGGVRVQDDRGPVRRTSEPVQGPAGIDQDRRVARQQPDRVGGTAPPALRHARQGAGVDRRGPGRGHRRGGEAERHVHR